MTKKRKQSKCMYMFTNTRALANSLLFKFALRKNSKGINCFLPFFRLIISYVSERKIARDRSSQIFHNFGSCIKQGTNISTRLTGTAWKNNKCNSLQCGYFHLKMLPSVPTETIHLQFGQTFTLAIPPPCPFPMCVISPSLYFHT